MTYKNNATVYPRFILNYQGFWLIAKTLSILTETNRKCQSTNEKMKRVPIYFLVNLCLENAKNLFIFCKFSFVLHSNYHIFFVTYFLFSDYLEKKKLGINLPLNYLLFPYTLSQSTNQIHFSFMNIREYFPRVQIVFEKY